jgi:LCP family protein required for cell wall assembly
MEVAMRSAPLWGIAGRAGYLLCCVASVVVLMTSGFSYILVRQVSALGGSGAIVSGPSIGEQNILLMGLESRTDWNGNVLPDDVLAALHAGSREGVLNGVGGNATNTLILIHIPAGGGKAVGFSIPRDDYVQFAGTLGAQQAGKIDQAYGISMAAKESQVRSSGQGLGQDQVAFQGNEAGRAATIATVEQLTGVHIDHFAEVNLDGFYEVAKVFGGATVCLSHPVPYDSYSGFFAHHAGLQHLDARGALAFVRQRHGLLNGDLDRTHRQQAVIDSLLHQLKIEGVFSDLARINSLLDAARQYVITDSGWNLLDFANQMRGLNTRNIVFRTLPITGYATIDGQDDNTVNVAEIQRLVHSTFYPSPDTPVPAPSGPTPGGAPAPSRKAVPPATPGDTTVDVYNGGRTPGLAGQVSTALTQTGYLAGKTGNTAQRAVTAVRYGRRAVGSADAIATAFGVTAEPGPAVPRGRVEIMLGADATAVPAFSAKASPTPAPASAAPATGNQANGGAVRSASGVPCVN